VDGEFGEDGIEMEGVMGDFLGGALSLVLGVECLCFWVDCDESAEPLLYVLIGKASYYFSSPESGRIKSHNP